MNTHLDLDALSAALERRLGGTELVLPPLPEVAAQLVEMFNEDDPEPNRLIALIGNDPVLAGHLLKAANSPLLRPAAPVATVRQAVSRLGMRMVGVTALSVCLGPQLFRAPAYSALIDRIWRESQATAVWSREIARLVRRNAEVAFLAGLLHQIGKPVVLQAIQQIDGSGGDARSSTEVEAMLARHAPRAGAAVVAAWRLPGEIGEPIRHWQDVREASTARDLVALVAAARRLARLDPQVAVTLEPEAFDYPEFAELQLVGRKLGSLLARATEIHTLVLALTG